MRKVYRYQNENPAAQRGVTLIELMISVSIAVILAASVAPSLQATISHNTIAAQMNKISALAQYARGHSIDNQIETTFCATSDYATCSNNWALAKMVFVDTNGDGERNANESLLASLSVERNNIAVQGPQNPVVFTMNGGANNNADILFCGEETSSHRALFISLQGRVKTSRDSDNNGVYEGRNGETLSCS
ncbi:Prepilin-type cleavage/methylation [Paraglaciecola sp. T6c]|uniref:GspH/FimT family pseudopilin n=1 Tax=Pseudoalteromonas atlantica (strain T6c / ATCC BAA-1087) TaxID=3042615 RepID=UPI00005C5A2C|nr:GspH/FimT family pseudopilin [Paraglaciecola sp. T6c]ABG41675.1 Prepilin-type cleavage/methylation [Paraglaciecola sp. T6c]